MNILENHPLKNLTTFHVGGPARYFAEIRNESELREAVNFAKSKSLKIFVMSGGSNILVSDNGFDGLVIQNRISGITMRRSRGKVLVTSGAGEKWDRLVEYTVNCGLEGLETLSGIPGSVGAAPVQNIGAYGREVSSVLKDVVVYDLKDNSVRIISKKECDFGYRKSIFNTTQKDRYLILAVIFEFKPPHNTQEPRGKAEFPYKDLRKYFTDKPNPTLKEIRRAVIEIRAKKGMVIRQEYESFKSAGSFFKNTVVSANAFQNIKKIIGEDDSKWFWLEPNGKVKLSAAKLIETAGYPKGFKIGQVGVSPKHSLSLINLGGASAGDILSLAKNIIRDVNKKFGIRLEPEVLFIGFKVTSS